jgi:hypothetical protein
MQHMIGPRTTGDDYNDQTSDQIDKKGGNLMFKSRERNKLYSIQF